MGECLRTHILCPVFWSGLLGTSVLPQGQRWTSTLIPSPFSSHNHTVIKAMLLSSPLHSSSTFALAHIQWNFSRIKRDGQQTWCVTIGSLWLQGRVVYSRVYASIANQFFLTDATPVLTWVELFITSQTRCAQKSRQTICDWCLVTSQPVRIIIRQRRLLSLKSRGNTFGIMTFYFNPTLKFPLSRANLVHHHLHENTWR